VRDENYRKAVKMDSEYFSPILDVFQTDLVKMIYDCLLEGTESTKRIVIELYKLNVYGTRSMYSIVYLPPLTLRYYTDKGSFFKPHVDTPRSKNMFGSLVIVFPTPHEGGALHLRHRGQEWIFDSGQVLAAKDKPSIGYAAFFSDIEHEVAPVTSGHRVTLTYNLYFENDEPISADDAVSKHLAPPLVNEGAFTEAFTALLEDPEFLAEGGTLAFGLRHVYPIKDDLKHVYNVLKGSDAVVYQSVRANLFEPVLYMYYKNDGLGVEGVLIDRVVNFTQYYDPEGQDLVQFLHSKGGIIVSRERERLRDLSESLYATAEQVEWVTPMTTINQKEDAYISYGNESTLDFVYGEVCLVVRIGKAGDRLAFLTAAELKKRRRSRRR
jgi:2OG-Fe(II) oxygenase superfamily